MNHLLYDYDLNPTTWVYLSSMMTIGIYFKFGRFWSVRNLDLFGLMALSPGFLMVAQGGQVEQFGYAWLFAVGGFFVVRLLSDPMMVRRPLLEPNLSPGALTFMGAALLVFLMTNVITHELTEADLEGPRAADQLFRRVEAPSDESYLGRHGPGYPLLHLVTSLPNRALLPLNEELAETVEQDVIHTATAQTMAILSHLAVVIGMVLIGYRHYGNIATGVAAASLYLLLPYTAIMVNRVDHVLPAALLVWAVLFYRRPLLSGMLVGLAVGAVYFPVFLLPLWIGFYWQRGWARFLIGATSMMALLIATLAFTSSSLQSFLGQLQQMTAWASFRLDEQSGQLHGFWSVNEPAYRIPVMAAFVAVCAGFALWPAQKNLGTLLSCSAQVMLLAQFWLAPDGGLYAAWYLPLLLLTVFRPNLEDRVALSVLGEGWFARRRAQPRRIEQAA